MPADPRSQAAELSALDQGRYQIVRQIGSGGMASVWHALDCGLGIPCAIKILNAPLARDPGLRTRFLHEAQTMARLRHPNIVEVKNLGEEEGRPYIVMQLIEGCSLSDQIVEHGPVPPQLAIDAMLAVLDAVAFAHQNGVIHRDIKPANVLLGHGPAFKLTDFGIARPLGARSGRLTQTNVAMGTWGFMAPEQSHNARDVDERADIYAAGATLFALLTGVEPIDLFVAEHDDTILASVPAALRDPIRTATFYHPEKRYPTATAMRDALALVRDELPADPAYPLPAPAEADAVSSTGFPSPSLAPIGGAIPTAIPSPNDFTTVPPRPQLSHEPDDDAEIDTLFPRHRRRWPLALVGLFVTGLSLGAYFSQPERTASNTVNAAATADRTPTPATETNPDPVLTVSTEPESEPTPELEPEPEPELEPEPEPTRPSTPAPAPAPTPKTTVTVTGEAQSVRLMSASGRKYRPGALPAGRYTVLADFGMGAAPAGQVTVSGRGAVTVHCVAAFATCTAK